MALIDTIHAMHRMAKAALATFQPDGERREAIARGISISYGEDPDDFAFLTEICGPNNEPLQNWHKYTEQADYLLASGLVQNEAGWRDISTAPKDGTRILAFAIRDKKPIIRVTYWRLPEDDAGYTGWGEFNETFWPPTHWQPLPAPPIRAARDGGAES